MRRIFVCVIFAAGVSTPTLAQNGDQRMVQAVVEGFLQHLGDHQFDVVAADLAPKAMIVVTRQRDGQWTNTYQTSDEWLAALRKNPNPTTTKTKSGMGVPPMLITSWHGRPAPC